MWCQVKLQRLHQWHEHLPCEKLKLGLDTGTLLPHGAAALQWTIFIYFHNMLRTCYILPQTPVLLRACLPSGWFLDDLSRPLVVGCSSVVHRSFLGGTPETMSSALVAGSASIDASTLQLGCPPQVANWHVLTCLDMSWHVLTCLDRCWTCWVIGSYWIISKGWTKFDNMFMPSGSCQTIFRSSDPAHVGNHAFKTERFIPKTQLRQLRHAYAVCIDLDSGSNYSAGDSGFVAYVSGWDFRDSPNSERVQEIS